MKKAVIAILCLCLICETCCAETVARIAKSSGNITFDANIYGANISQATVYKVALKASDSNMDSAIMELFDRILFRRTTMAEIFEERDADPFIERDYYTPEGKEQEHADYSFYEGAICASTYASGFYYGIMDIFRQYDGACYIPDRLECGDLPMMSAKSAVIDLHDVAVQLGLNVEEAPYILRAYSMDNQLASSEGIHPYIQMVVQGNDLTAENRTIVSEYGSDCYFIAYRYAVDGIPVAYSYFYLESQDFFTPRSQVYALYNNDGMIAFASLNQFEIIESVESHTLITAEEAADKVAEHFSRILGIEPFVCKEISLEYVPLPYSGCDIAREAMLTPAWVFYFEGDNVTPVLVNAIDGTIIN